MRPTTQRLGIFNSMFCPCSARPALRRWVCATLLGLGRLPAAGWARAARRGRGRARLCPSRSGAPTAAAAGQLRGSRARRASGRGTRRDGEGTSAEARGTSLGAEWPRRPGLRCQGKREAKAGGDVEGGRTDRKASRTGAAESRRGEVEAGEPGDGDRKAEKLERGGRTGKPSPGLGGPGALGRPSPAAAAGRTEVPPNQWGGGENATPPRRDHSGKPGGEPPGG